MKELNQKLAFIKKKQFQLPLSSSLRQNSGSTVRPSTMRAQGQRGKLLEVVSNLGDGQQQEKSPKVIETLGMSRTREPEPNSSALPAKPLVWNLQRTNSTILKR